MAQKNGHLMLIGRVTHGTFVMALKPHIFLSKWIRYRKYLAICLLEISQNYNKMEAPTVRIDILDSIFMGAYMVPEMLAVGRVGHKWMDGVVERGWVKKTNDGAHTWYARTMEATQAEITALTEYFGGLDVAAVPAEIDFTDGRKVKISRMAQSHLDYIENMRPGGYAQWAYINNLKELQKAIEAINQ